jgi:flagellar basal body-associated protein FliL
VIIIGLLVAAAAGVGVWKFAPGSKDAHGIVEPEEMEKKAEEPKKFGEVFQLSDIVINPAGSRRVFMVVVTLELADPEMKKEVEKREALLRDNLITLFASQPLEVLIDIKYRQAFRARVKKIMDHHLGEGIIARVFFEKWVFQ